MERGGKLGGDGGRRERKEEEGKEGRSFLFSELQRIWDEDPTLFSVLIKVTFKHRPARWRPRGHDVVSL